jgi:hypothetical protein
MCQGGTRIQSAGTLQVPQKAVFEEVPQFQFKKLEALRVVNR